MARSRVQVARIESYQPQLDYRKLGKVGVLSGRNFAWDASGVKCDFATRLMSSEQHSTYAIQSAQSIRAGSNWLTVIGDQLSRFVPEFIPARVGNWDHLKTLVAVQATNPAHLRQFTTGHLGGYSYISSWLTGCYRVDSDGDARRLMQIAYPGWGAADRVVVAGFPADDDPLIAIAETNARMMYLTKTAIYWSGPGDAEDLTPALGGAGFQVLGERVAGEPRAMLAIPNGIMIWTDSGVLVGEFIGGPSVFRWYQTEVDTSPLSQSAITTMPDGSYMLLTRQGLHRLQSQDGVAPVSPLFNEFLRDYIRLKEDATLHLWYSVPDNRLFIGVREATGIVTETFSYDISLDRWGIMSHWHRGLIQYESGSTVTGFLDVAGYAHYLLSPYEWSSTQQAPDGSFYPLESEVTIGYIRDESFLRDGDGMQELTDIVVFHNRSSLDSYYRLVDEGSIADGSYVSTDEGSIAFLTGAITTDEGTFAQASLGTLGYKVDFLSDFNTVDEITGIDYGTREAYLANHGVNSDIWTGGIYGHYISMRFYINEEGEGYRLNAIDCNLAFGGQIV